MDRSAEHEQIQCSVAGVGFAIRLPSGSLAQELKGCWEPYGARGSLDFVLEVTETRASACGWVGQRPMPRLERLPDETFEVEGAGFEASVSKDRREARIQRGGDRFGIEAMIKLLLADHLLARGGLLVHAVAVALGGRAALFPGMSGAGKSTLGALVKSSGGLLLADELVAVVGSKCGFVANGTPWNQGAPASAPLGLAGVLEHHPRHQVEPWPPSEVLRTLMPNLLFADSTGETRSEGFRISTALVQAVPCAKLRFARDKGVAAALREALST